MKPSNNIFFSDFLNKEDCCNLKIFFFLCGTDSVIKKEEEENPKCNLVSHMQNILFWKKEKEKKSSFLLKKKKFIFLGSTHEKIIKKIKIHNIKIKNNSPREIDE